MHVRTGVVSMRLAKEGDHCHDDQQSFQAFATRIVNAPRRRSSAVATGRREFLIYRVEQPFKSSAWAVTDRSA